MGQLPRLGLIMILSLTALLSSSVTLSSSSYSVGVEPHGLFGPAEAYVGTDYWFLARTPGEEKAVQAVVHGMLGEPRLIPLTNREGRNGTVLEGVILGSWLQYPGPITLVLRSQSGKEYGRMCVQVVVPPESAALADSQLLAIGVEATYTRWFYDVERAGNLLNGVNITNIASAIMSPVRDVSGNEVWPNINFSHNTPEAGTTSSSVQPHRGLDIARTNGQSIWAVIGSTVYAKDATNKVLTTRTDLDGNGTTDLYVQYEHINPSSSLSSGSPVYQSTVVGTIAELNHLHIRFDNPSRFSMPQKLFWSDSPWQTPSNGSDADFVKVPSASNGVITVAIHGWNVNGSRWDEYGKNTRVCHRRLGTTPFTVTPMVMQTGYVYWTANISAYYSPGQTIEYYIETMRHDLPDDNRRVYRPVYYKMYWDGPVLECL